MTQRNPVVPSTASVLSCLCATALPTTLSTASGRRVCGAACPGPVPEALDTLPQVVIGTMLQFMPRDHYVWRCIAALDLAQRLSVSPSEPWKTVELSQVVSWERGTPPEIATREAVGSLPSLLRLTLDLDGLKKVERLTERPQFSRRRFDNEAFVLEQEDQLGATTIAHFKNGLLRFSMPGSLEEPGLAFWDTPTPPDPAQCLVRPYRLNSRFRFHTIDLSAVTGLTFFLYSGRMMGIHGHTRSRPCALATYSTIRGLDEMDEFCSWVYVPVAPRDAILRCGSLRAVGQCRLFVVRSTTHPRPSSLAWEEVPSSTYNRAGRFPDCHCYKPLHIRFDSPEDAVGNNNLKWSHYAMAGTLEFWLFESFAAISIKGGTKISPEDHSDRESMPEVSTDV
ncbi:hypothetical protein C8A00DRAFT_42075 [Chaetomidium leptoderma]|uniref:F-box domain-containing protein n=1 Tax=Chaetomidium leptoderma TaxID=669021 RepID=A0AAN6ZY79_9PEZI|nr:hypothetical protein C8A00DRAFT_42075 [Chaetomidium leptoderma]